MNAWGGGGHTPPALSHWHCCGVPYTGAAGYVTAYVRAQQCTLASGAGIVLLSLTRVCSVGCCVCPLPMFPSLSWPTWRPTVLSFTLYVPHGVFSLLSFMKLPHWHWHLLVVTVSSLPLSLCNPLHRHGDDPGQDEYLTSKICNTCYQYLQQVSPREKKCNSAECAGKVFNRDDNASKNLEAVWTAWLNGKERPWYLSRNRSANSKASPASTTKPLGPGSPASGHGASPGAPVAAHPAPSTRGATQAASATGPASARGPAEAPGTHGTGDPHRGAASGSGPTP